MMYINPQIDVNNVAPLSCVSDVLTLTDVSSDYGERWVIGLTVGPAPPGLCRSLAADWVVQHSALSLIGHKYRSIQHWGAIDDTALNITGSSSASS